MNYRLMKFLGKESREDKCRNLYRQNNKKS